MRIGALITFAIRRALIAISVHTMNCVLITIRAAMIAPGLNTSTVHVLKPVLYTTTVPATTQETWDYQSK